MQKSRLDTIGQTASELNRQYHEISIPAENLLQRYYELWNLLNPPHLGEQGIVRSIQRYIHKKKQRRLQEEYGAILPRLNEFQEQLYAITVDARTHFLDNEILYYHAALLEATRAGVPIKIEDPTALTNARWQEEHLPADQGSLYPIEAFAVTHLTVEELERNLQRYPEMQYHFDSEELTDAREFLFHIPLTHMTRNVNHIYSPSNTALLTPLRSYHSLHTQGLTHTSGPPTPEKVKGITYALDSALQLDHYVYMCMGSIYLADREEHPNSAVLLFDPHILLDKGCIVTPDDISNIVIDLFQNEVVESEAQIQDVKSYRSSVVTGAGWLEILSRRVALYHRAYPDTPIPLMALFTLGEIKYKDQVPESAFRGILSTDTEIRQYFHDMAPYIVVPPIDQLVPDTRDVDSVH